MCIIKKKHISTNKEVINIKQVYYKIKQKQTGKYIYNKISKFDRN